jgi:hypothetical protein
MSRGKTSITEEPLVVDGPIVSEGTRREMEVGREAARLNGLAQERAEAARILEAASKAALDAEQKQQQADEKLRVVAEAEAAHAAKASAQTVPSV